jgi:hypothetical protein
MSFSYISGKPSKRSRFKYWMSDFWDSVKSCLIIILLFILGTFAVCTPIYLLGKQGCKETAAKMSVPYSFNLFTECMVQINGSWIPLSNYVLNQPK